MKDLPGYEEAEKLGYSLYSYAGDKKITRKIINSDDNSFKFVADDGDRYHYATPLTNEEIKAFMVDDD